MFVGSISTFISQSRIFWRLVFVHVMLNRKQSRFELGRKKNTNKPNKCVYMERGRQRMSHMRIIKRASRIQFIKLDNECAEIHLMS